MNYEEGFKKLQKLLSDAIAELENIRKNYPEVDIECGLTEEIELLREQVVMACAQKDEK